MVVESARCAALGPRSGISDVRRLIRGVKLKIISYEDISFGKVTATVRADLTNVNGTGEQRRANTRGVKRGVI
eukprot:2063340-Prymnesium_polylepis.1